MTEPSEITIKNRYTSEQIYSGPKTVLRDTVLCGADLRDTDLRYADLCDTDLRGADLCGADLRNAVLCGAVLRDTVLCGADLRDTDLRGADLCGADLRNAVLRGAVLRDTDLCGADLCGADLRNAVLRDTVLRDTVLDPDAKPHTPTDWPQMDGDYAIGYRTRKAGHIDKYRDGRIYSADWFSVCPHTECHPGLYLWPTLKAARDWAGNSELIRVRTKLSEIHQAGTKYRCRWFEVLGSVDS